jgi:hypothetical protein
MADERAACSVRGQAADTLQETDHVLPSSTSAGSPSRWPP